MENCNQQRCFTSLCKPLRFPPVSLDDVIGLAGHFGLCPKCFCRYCFWELRVTSSFSFFACMLAQEALCYNVFFK